MAYTSLNFVPGEILTAAKMNLLAANDASLRDGTGILDNSIQLSKIRGGKLKWNNVSYENGFSALNSGGYQIPQYSKDVFGTVRLRGIAKHSQSNATERAMFTLPTGFRPAASEIFATPNASTVGRVNINPNGQVLLSSSHSPSSAFVSLSGISFQAA